MATNFLKSNLIVTTGFMNTVNDPTPGASVTSVTGEQRYAGMLGGVIALGPNDVLSTPAGTLFGGIYMYVQVSATHTAAPGKGQAAFWLPASATFPEGNYVVSPDGQPSLNPSSLVAGVFLNAITPGNFGFIQIAGRATCLFDSSITTTSAGKMVLSKANASLASTFDNFTGNPNADQVISAIGISETAPATSSLSTVLMWGRFLRV